MDSLELQSLDEALDYLNEGSTISLRGKNKDQLEELIKSSKSLKKHEDKGYKNCRIDEIPNMNANKVLMQISVGMNNSVLSLIKGTVKKEENIAGYNCYVVISKSGKYVGCYVPMKMKDKNGKIKYDFVSIIELTVINV